MGWEYETTYGRSPIPDTPFSHVSVGKYMKLLTNLIVFQEKLSMPVYKKWLRIAV